MAGRDRYIAAYLRSEFSDSLADDDVTLLTRTAILDTVAPGIAEALFATALGLVAAIPAAGAYNILSGQVGRYAQQLEAFAGEFITILSRQLEEQV